MPDRVGDGHPVAAQNVLVNLGALVTTLLAGAAANWLGVRAIAIAIALITLAGKVAVIVATREPRGADLRPPAQAQRRDLTTLRRFATIRYVT